MDKPVSVRNWAFDQRHSSVLRGVWFGLLLTLLLAISTLVIEGLGEQAPLLLCVLPVVVAAYFAGVWTGNAIPKEAHATLERVLSGAGEGITLRDVRGHVVFANDMAAQLVGMESARQLLTARPSEFGRRFELFQTNGEPFAFEKLPSNRALSSGDTCEEVLGFRAANAPAAHLRWVRVRANPTRNKCGRVSGVVTLFRDVTDARHQEEALVLAHEWFQSALKSIADAVITTDDMGTVNMLNPVAEQLLGVASSDAVGRHVTRLFRAVSETTRGELENPVSWVLRNGCVSELPHDSLLVLPDGSEIAVENTASPIRNHEGELRGVILVFRDVSEKRARDRQQEFLARATVELNSSLDYRRTLATVAQVAVPLMADWCAVDVWEEGEVRRLAVAHIDPEKIRLVEEIERRYPTDPNTTSGTYNILRTGRAEMLPVIPQALIERAAKNAEHLELIRALELHSYLGVPMLREGKAFGVITFAFAESNRRYTNSDLALAQTLADRAAVSVEHARLMASAEEARVTAVKADRTKSDFLAMLGHELRNPLAPIQTALELMRADARVARGTEYKIIERQVKHVVRLVDDLLDTSRITHGKVELSLENVVLVDVMERVREMLTLGGGLRGHQVEFLFDSNLGVHGDPTRLAQVFSNLLMNACKYTAPGGKVCVTAKETEDVIVVRVEDEGIGIEPEMLPLIFETFIQEPQALDRAQGGLGLGLAIVRGLVTAHGGRVRAQSDGLGQGAAFEVELPKAKVEQRTEVVAAALPPMASALRILVVDDNVDAAEMLGLLLERRGHDVRTATSGAQAIDLAAHHAPNVALLDVGLPDMSGYELGRRLRSIQGLGGLPIAAITGYGQDEDEQKSRDAGFVAHLVKPVDMDEIGQLLSSLNSCVSQATGSHIQ